MWCRSVVYSSSCTTTPISPWKGARSSADKKKTWVIDLIECSRFRKFQEILFNTRKCWQENMWIIICVPIFWKYWSICEMLKEKTYRNWAWKWQFHFKVIFLKIHFDIANNLDQFWSKLFAMSKWFFLQGAGYYLWRKSMKKVFWKGKMTSDKLWWSLISSSDEVWLLKAGSQ